MVVKLSLHYGNNKFGQKARVSKRPKELDLRSSREGVHGFDSHPSHTEIVSYLFLSDPGEEMSPSFTGPKV